MARLGLPMHQRFKALLERALNEGMGYHEQIIHSARLMKMAGVEPELACEIMEDAGDCVKRRAQENGEVRRVVNFIYSGDQEFRPYEVPKHGAKCEPQLIAEFAKNGSIKDLMNKSEKIPETTGEILSSLYAPKSLVHLSPHVCNSQGIKSVEEWSNEDLSGYQYVCPAHMKSRELGRCNKNIDFRRYIVWESDRDGLAYNWDRQAGIITKLAESMPLKMVCFSGHKSLHAWYDCSTRRKDWVSDFLSLCVQCGADKQTLRVAQLVRLPWAIRKENGKIQKPIYYER